MGRGMAGPPPAPRPCAGSGASISCGGTGSRILEVWAIATGCRGQQVQPWDGVASLCPAHSGDLGHRQLLKTEPRVS